MAIDLLNRFTQAQVNKSMTTSGETVKPADSVETARILNTVLSLKAGDVLRGELLSVNGKDISLLLGNAVTLGAKMEKELSLSPGQSMSFIVGSNNNGKLSLRPLFANVGMEQNAMKALDAAHIPVTEKTLALVDEMMRQGMSVNKDNLATVYRQMNMHMNADLMDLVMLHKMNIPVTEENISMMHLYQTNQHHLFSDMQGLSSRLSDLVAEMMQEQPSNVSQDFVQALLDIFKGTHVMVQETDSAVTDAQNGSNAQNVTTTETPVNAMDAKAVTEQNGQVAEQSQYGQQAAGKAFGAVEETFFKEAELWKMLSNKETLQTPDGKELLTQNLFSLLKEQFLMKPEDIRSAEYVKEFYEHLSEQVDKLQHLIKSVGKEESALGKEVNTVKSNIQFMNQMNEMYHYVQLPIKMNEKGANGDLYVYKRKKAKTDEDGKLTALLHLTMPTLGNMDVFLSLENEKLSTRFCMEKEEMIDFIESHIEELNARLVKRGYNVQTVVTVNTRQEEQSVIDAVMTTEPAIPVITSQSFDARC